MVGVKLLLAALVVPFAVAHPGETHNHAEVERELTAQRHHTARMKRGLDACATHPNYLALKARGAERRTMTAEALRAKRAITGNMKARRDDTYTAYAGKSHNYTTEGYSLDTAATELFANYKNVSCGLTPKVTEGPYYVTGEYYRSDVVESQAGVPLHLEVEFIDISTCDAAQGIYVEMWHCNATGVYSGVVASGNGAGTADQSNLNNTFLRGVQQTGSDGVVAFDSIFPGHYTGRATHIHLLSHQNGTVLQNGTFTSATVQSVGQLGFDQSLIADVETQEPYSSNTQTATENTADSILGDEADENNDPFSSYVYLGDDISDGLLAWAHVGYDSSASYSVSAGAYLYATGGVAGSGGFGSGGFGSDGPPGMAPSGASGPGRAMPTSATALSSATDTAAQPISTASVSSVAAATSTSGANPANTPNPLTTLLDVVRVSGAAALAALRKTLN